MNRIGNNGTARKLKRETVAQIHSVGAHAADAERYMTAALLMEPALVPKVQHVISAGDVYQPRERLIVSTIFALADRGADIDAAIIAGELVKIDKLAEAGGSEYLHELLEAIPHTAHAVTYAKQVAEKARRRRLAHKAHDLLGMLADPGIETDDAAEFADGLTAHVGNTSRVERFTYSDLLAAYPRLRPPLIDGILRECETINIVSKSKEGKTWMTEGIALDFVTGRPWLGVFQTACARCLLMDFELHRETLAYRLKTIAEAKSLTPNMIGDKLEVWPLRGMRKSIYDLRADLRAAAGRFKLVIIDAKYRATGNANENDNDLQRQFYDEIDHWAGVMQAGFLLVLHGSKGEQGSKDVTDVGAGAGAQSRAVDCHLTIRAHEQEGRAVLEGKLRSFKPIEPLGLNFNFPLWEADGEIDPTLLKGRKSAGEERQGRTDGDTESSILTHCRDAWRSRNEIRTLTGFGEQRTNRGIRLLLDTGRLEQSTEDRPRNPGIEVFRSKPDEK